MLKAMSCEKISTSKSWDHKTSWEEAWKAFRGIFLANRRVYHGSSKHFQDCVFRALLRIFHFSFSTFEAKRMALASRAPSIPYFA